MSDMTPLFVRLPADDARALDQAVAATGKSKRRLVSDAVRLHLDDERLVVGHAALNEAAPEVLTPAEASALLQIPEADVVASVERGELPGRQIAGHWRFGRAALLAWLGAASPSG
jgi:excisionase family DNA binding protein